MARFFGDSWDLWFVPCCIAVVVVILFCVNVTQQPSPKKFVGRLLAEFAAEMFVRVVAVIAIIVVVIVSAKGCS